jgi:hypothetical protein
MKNRIKIAFLFLFVLWAPLAFGQNKETKAVRKAFENYKDAVSQSDGKEAANYLNARSFAYYDQIIEWVRKADSAQVDALPILSKLMVFTVRVKVAREDVLKFNGHALFVHAVNAEMLSKKSYNEISIGDVSIDGETAKGDLVIKGEKSDYQLLFNKENGEWKIDLNSYFALSESVFKMLIDRSNQSENDFLLMILEYGTGKKAGREIWLPVQ